MNKRTLLSTTLSPLLAALLLAGCGKSNDTQTGNTGNDTTVAKAEQKADDMKADAAQGMERAKEATKNAANDVKDASKNAMDSTKNAVEDAAITTSVKASLAKDKDLRALAINVDTSGGAVALHGTAPDPAARERATQIASAVKGVQSVDNQLTIKQ